MLFDEAVEIILFLEAGYVNDPKDPGGETNFGISKRAFPEIDIKNLSRDHAKYIYQSNYWNPCQCGALPDDLSLAVFDTAVNQGTRKASILLQQSVYAFVDGRIGPKTIAKTHAHAKTRGIEETLKTFFTQRILSYTKLDNFEYYGKGWLNRVNHVQFETYRRI